jgi:hypothetical protein
MTPFIFVALCAILLSFGGVIILSGALLFSFRPKTRAGVFFCIVGPAIAVAPGLLWWGSATDFFGSKRGAIPWLIVTPALICASIGVVTATLAVAALRCRLTTTRPRPAIWKILIVVPSVLLLSAMAVALGEVVYIERDTWKPSFRISKALRNARSVTFVEFRGQFVLARKVAMPEDIARFQNAISPWFLPYGPSGSLCSVPHHRVEIVRVDGTALTFFVCFLCGNFYLDPLAADASTGGSVDLPPSWEKSLSSFFASIGMAPKTYEEYSALDHRDSNDQDPKVEP